MLHRKTLHRLLVPIVVDQVSVVVVHAGGFFQGVSALQTMDQVALDYPRPSENFWVLN